MTAATPLPDLPADRDVTPIADGTVTPGSHDRLGATVTGDGVDFAVFAKRASGVELVLFDGVDDVVAGPDRGPRPDPRPDRRLLARPRRGHRSRPAVRLSRARAVGAARRPAVRRDEGPPRSVRAGRRDPGGLPTGARRATPSDGAIPMKSVVVDGSDYDWEGDQRIERPFRHTVIYEAHVAGFTADPSSGVAAGRRGTYAGFIDKIPYLVDLGITAVELLPVFAFDRLAAPAGLVNYWGYQPVAFFAPHAGVCQRGRAHGRRGRVPRPGQGAPPGRHRGHPRRRLQPHRRGRRGRPDVRLPRLRQRHLLPAGR